MELINISNHPLDDDIQRKACRSGIESDEYRLHDQKYINLNVLVTHFKNGIPYVLIPDYIFTLKADNSTLVDPLTGNYVDNTFPDAMGEADYFIDIIATSNISMDNIAQMAIIRADNYQKLNNYSSARIVNWM